MAKAARKIADQLRQILIEQGNAEHAAGMQRYFKQAIRSHGWYTSALRQLARRWREEIRRQDGLPRLIEVSDELFAGDFLEEKLLGVLLLDGGTQEFGAKEFRLFETWLDRVGSWSDHDALVQYLIGPMVVADPRRLARVFRWAKSKNHWHRRASAVALLRGTNRGMFWDEVQRIAWLLAGDEDDMVRKGLGWLLRETARYDGARTIPLLLALRGQLPRSVLRTACERLDETQRRRVLER